MASAVEKERARRAEIERAYVAPKDPVAWRNALVADRPSVTVDYIVAAAEAVGWTTHEMYRETYAEPRWVAVDGEAHVYEAKVMKVYDLYAAAETASALGYRIDGKHVLCGVHVLAIDGTAKRIRLGYSDKDLWTPGPSVSSVAKLIRESQR